MEGQRFIHKIKLQNFLSYGSDGEEIELQPLNVLIGRNTSGKSNLIEAISILKAIIFAMILGRGEDEKQ